MSPMVDIVLRVVYEDHKARTMAALPKGILGERIRQDMTKTKLPHPPADNINSPPADGPLILFWTTRRHSPLYCSIERVIQSQDKDPILKQAKKACAIQTISMSFRSPSAISQSREDRRSSSLAFSTNRRSSVSTVGRGDSYRPASSRSRDWRSERRGSIEADDLLSSLSYKDASSFNELSSRVFPRERARQRSRSPLRTLTISPSRTGARRKGDFQDEDEEKKAKRQKLSEPASIIQESLRSSPVPFASPSKYTLCFPDAITVPAINEATPLSEPSNPVTLPVESSESQNETKTSDTSPTLLREYWDNRRQLTAVSARALSLQEEMQGLGVEYHTWQSNQDLQLRVTQAEAELAKERRKRIEVEHLLKEVEKERRQPTLVPELLRIFSMFGAARDVEGEERK
ncbi:hypothetical protein C8J56DRAFT_322677 [Mycena floridula]|nr:hypothetical protein C8J56DRAFT_322677 [Mycena floridula]